MTWDLSKLGKCAVHGHHAGKVCPLCDAAPSVPIPAPAPPPMPAVDRSKWYPGPEKELHDLFALEMIRLDVSFIHARTDQKSTIAVGWPDFSTFFTAPDGVTRACFVELKNKAGRTSKDQDECIASLRKLNIPVLVTGDFREASDFVKTHLSIK